MGSSVQGRGRPCYPLPSIYWFLCAFYTLKYKWLAIVNTKISEQKNASYNQRNL